MPNFTILSWSDYKACHRELESAFPEFVDIACEELNDYDVSEQVRDYYRHAIQYNLQGGKLLRGTLLLATVKCLHDERICPKVWQRAKLLGWCVELLQSAFLVADDIMDASQTRRSNPCWYLVPTIGVANAVNDTLFLNTLLYRIIQKCFIGFNALLDIIDTFTSVTMTTILGQHMDTYDTVNLDIFQRSKNSLEATSLYNRICKNKTAHYSFYLPIKLGMILARVPPDNLNITKIKSTAFLLGHLFQVQDDYLDCFGNVSTTGKVGTDIQSRKCTWLLTTALVVASTDEAEEIHQNIGSPDPEKVARVKEIYTRLQIPTIYQTYVHELHNSIRKRIDQIQHPGLESLLQWSLENITNRKL